MILTDTHAHLYVEQFNDDRNEMIQRAIDGGVSRLFLPNIDLDSVEGMLLLSKQFPTNCFPLIGLHPCSVKEDYQSVLTTLHKFMETNTFYGIGEVGMDLYWDKTTLAFQQEALKIQINWAKEAGLPIILHCRDAFEELMEVMEAENDDRLGGIFHCFTGGKDDAERILNLGGFKLGIGGIVTFKNSGLAETLASIDLQHLVLETDSPYLSPVPYRGKRNESAYLMRVAEKLCDIYHKPIEEIAKITTANSSEIFKK